MQRADAALEDFTVHDVPHFSRTILTASPILSALSLESGERPPLPHPRLGVTSTSPATSMVRSTNGAASDAEAEVVLPSALQTLLRLHKRAAYKMFERWERTDSHMVSLQQFADGIYELTSLRLTEGDMLAVLQCAEPMRGEDVLSEPFWADRPIDSRRIFRECQKHAARLASEYIKQQSPPKAARRSSTGAAAARGSKATAPK